MGSLRLHQLCLVAASALVRPLLLGEEVGVPLVPLLVALRLQVGWAVGAGDQGKGGISVVWMVWGRAEGRGSGREGAGG